MQSINVVEASRYPNVMEVMVTISDRMVRALFNSGSTHIFMDSSIVEDMGLEVVTLDYSL